MRVYCESCIGVQRLTAGSELLEGPLNWGRDWSEVAAWLVRARSSSSSRKEHKLLALEIRRILPLLGADIPESVREFLNQHGSLNSE